MLRNVSMCKCRWWRLLFLKIFIKIHFCLLSSFQPCLLPSVKLPHNVQNLRQIATEVSNRLCDFLPPARRSPSVKHMSPELSKRSSCVSERVRQRPSNTELSWDARITFEDRMLVWLDETCSFFFFFMHLCTVLVHISSEKVCLLMRMNAWMAVG